MISLASLRVALFVAVVWAGNAMALQLPGIPLSPERPTECSAYVSDLQQCLTTLSKGHLALKACVNQQQLSDVQLEWLPHAVMGSAAGFVVGFLLMSWFWISSRGHVRKLADDRKYLLSQLDHLHRCLQASSSESFMYAAMLMDKIPDEKAGKAAGAKAGQQLSQLGALPAPGTPAAAATPGGHAASVSAAPGTPAAATTPAASAAAASPAAAATPGGQGTPASTAAPAGTPSSPFTAPDGSRFITEKDLQLALLSHNNQTMARELMIRDLLTASSPARSPVQVPMDFVNTRRGAPATPAAWGASGSGSPSLMSANRPGMAGSPAGSIRVGTGVLGSGPRPSPSGHQGQSPAAGTSTPAAAASAKDPSRSRLGVAGQGVSPVRDFSKDLLAASSNGGSPAAAQHKPWVPGPAAASPAVASPAAAPPAAAPGFGVPYTAAAGSTGSSSSAAKGTPTSGRKQAPSPPAGFGLQHQPGSSMPGMMPTISSHPIAAPPSRSPV